MHTNYGFFIHSFTDGRLSYFRILAIINYAAMIWGGWQCRQLFELAFLFPLDKHPEGPVR